MKAWRTTWGGITSIVAAATRGAARAMTMHSARDAGYRSVRFRDVQVRRAPEHDAWAEVDATGACWDEKLLPTYRPTASTATVPVMEVRP